MGALPNSEPAAIRYAGYIEELHEFFGTCGIPYGSPEGLAVVAARLQQSGSFADDLSSLIRSFMLRQGGSMPHAEVMEILSSAIAGSDLKAQPQAYSESLRQLLGFIAGVQRRPWNVPPNAPGEVVPFPTDSAATTVHSVPTFAPLTNERPDPGPTPVPAKPILAPNRRRGLWTGAVAAALVAIAAVLAIARMHRPSEIYQIQPEPPATLQQSSGRQASDGTVMQPTTAPAAQPMIPQPSASVAHTAKPSAYGTLVPSTTPKHVQSSSGWTNAQPSQGYYAAGRTTQPAPAPSAPVATTPTTAFAPYNPPNEATQAAAPIVRQPANVDPDSYIAGDLPPGSTAADSPSRFTVSSGVMAGYLLFAPEPGYPLLARLAHAQGKVTLLVVVAKDGTVQATRVLRGNHLLRAAAEDAVAQFRYRPYRIDGKAVEIATVVTVDFHDPADPSDSQEQQ